MVILLQLYPNPAHRGRATVVFKQSTNLANALGAPTYGYVFALLFGWFGLVLNSAVASLDSRHSIPSIHLAGRLFGFGPELWLVSPSSAHSLSPISVSPTLSPTPAVNPRTRSDRSFYRIRIPIEKSSPAFESWFQRYLVYEQYCIGLWASFETSTSRLHIHGPNLLLS
jgi:hypothetical protein